MNKSYCSLGLMSGTSADGVDASIIQSDGDNVYKVILNKYFKYNKNIYESIHYLKDRINELKDLKNLSKEIQILEKEITLFHIDVVKEVIKGTKSNIDIVGFHGQTIFHNGKKKISKQLGDGKLLSKLTKKTVINDFRKNDLKNGGNGAPLTPIFHKLLREKLKTKDSAFINLGGIANITTFSNNDNMFGTDIGPGMCLIDKWMRKNAKKNYDKNGTMAKSGKVNKAALAHLLKNFYNMEKILYKDSVKSYDIKDFDFLSVKNLSLKDGAATLTEFTFQVLISFLKKNNHFAKNIILCGGGRKNGFLIEKLKKKKITVKLIDEYDVNGDFVESQAFAYLAIRSYLNLPISFPSTTGVTKPSTGGIIFKN